MGSEKKETTHLWEWIQHWMDKNDRNQTYVGKQLGLDRGAMTRWKYGDSQPSATEMQKLAELINIPYIQLREAASLDRGYGTDGPVKPRVKMPKRSAG